MVMKVSPFSRTGARTLTMRGGVAAIFAKSLVTAPTTLLLPRTYLERRCALTPRRKDELLCPLLLSAILAALILPMLAGCGGSSGSGSIVPPVTATPSISPGTGTYVGTQQVTISDATSGATIYYTTDGSVPTASSRAYTGPISIANSSTVQAIAILQGSSSAVASAALTITPAHPPAKLAFVQQPSNSLAGIAISPAVQVAVQDANGNAVTGATNPVTLALTSGTGLGGTLTVTAQNGVATFSNLSVGSAGTYMLSATSAGLTSATSASFTIAVPVKLAFVVQPSNALTGASISPAVQVAVQDASGNTVTAATTPVTVALTSGTGLGGTLTVTPQNGVATFSNLSVSAAGTYTLSATSSGLTSATSTSFTITTPVKLAFVVQPSNAFTETPISPAVQVAIQDASGNTVTADTDPVTLALAGGSGLGGTLTVTPQNGVAVFSNLTLSTAGSYMLSATSSGLTSATSSSFTITILPATYYLSPNGNDSNSGLAASLPWLSPDHPLNCGDHIIAASGTYSAANFNTGKWGTVTCPSGDNVAWLQCATFDTCKISTATLDGMWVDENYWGVQGWEISTSTNIYAACFHAGPKSATSVNVHHVIFANDVANGCMGGGFTAYDLSTSASVDYIAYVGNIAFNSAQGSGECYSGFNIYQPIASDTSAGTHLFIAGNFSYGNLDPNPCNGTAPTDGEGIILDTFDFSHDGGPAYAQQVLVENNIVVNNGGRGIEVFNNSAGSAHAAISITQNTSWGNLTDPNQNGTGCGEVSLQDASDTQVYGNLVSTRSATGCGLNPVFALSVQNGNATDSVDSNFAFGYSGNNTFVSGSGTFAFGSKNILGTNPAFSNPTAPGAPNCQSTSNVANCMATVISDFVPTAASAKGFGYQTPSSTPTADPLFPQWLCNVNLPPGLVTLGCAKP
jgi:hypothetical protein